MVPPKTNDEVVSHLEKRLDEAIVELEAIRAESRRIQAREAIAAKKVSAYRIALSIERGEDPEQGNKVPESEGSRTIVIKDFIYARDNRGATPREIRDFLKQKGVASNNPNFVYGALDRLRNRKKIVKRGDRYYPEVSM